jgi:hypothetical protein
MKGHILMVNSYLNPNKIKHHTEIPVSQQRIHITNIKFQKVQNWKQERGI